MEAESVQQPWWHRLWGSTHFLIQSFRKVGLIDLLLVLGLAGLAYGLADMGGQWTREHRAAVEIDLSRLTCLPGHCRATPSFPCVAV
jgi:hypothetical protein